MSGDQKVFVHVSMSLDGYMAPEGMVEHFDDPGYKDWQNKWMSLQAWMFPSKFFRENLDLGEGGETGTDNDLAEATFKRTGVSIMGKRMFDQGEQAWPEEPPFHTPVFVVTHEKREPWERPGGTTFHFVNDGIDSALKRARGVADGQDIRVSGGADTIVQYLNAGLVDELEIGLAPLLLGGGTSLIREIDPEGVTLEITEAIHSPRVTHLRYQVHEVADIWLARTVDGLGHNCTDPDTTKERNREKSHGYRPGMLAGDRTTVLTRWVAGLESLDTRTTQKTRQRRSPDPG